MARDETRFATTCWTVVLDAASISSPQAAAALNDLCQTYWKPLYAYLRRCGHSAQDAEDLTQGFLAHLLANQALRTVSPLKGKFRSFLLASLKNYLANERGKAIARKRGCGQPCLALDDPSVEQSYLREPVDHLSPDKIYERHWAHTLLEQVRRRLRDEYAAAAKSDRFELLAGFLPGEQSPVTQAVAAQRLGMSEGAFKVEAHRLRQRFRAALRDEVAHTVSRPEEIDEELRHLIRIVSQ